MTELDNCERCNKVFVRTMRSICPDCYRKEEEEFQRVYKFLTKRKNREATIPEIVQATDVAEDTIHKFIKERRLRTSEFPSLTYPCEKCGAGIVEGNLCMSCTDSLRKALELHEHEREQEEQRKKDEQAVYFAIDRKKDRE